jgi:hypothetical protein
MADTSMCSICPRPPGFHVAAVASSAIAMKAPPIPNALAPKPIGALNWVSTNVCPDMIKGQKISKKNRKNFLTIYGLLVNKIQ